MEEPENVYLYDAVRMGEPCGNGVEMMYSHHPSEDRTYIILVNKFTGRRWKINFNGDEKLTAMEFRLLGAEWRLYLIDNKQSRAGQGLMNVLQKIRPDLYKKITGTDIDPFHNNERIGACLRLICTDEDYLRLNPAFQAK